MTPLTNTQKYLKTVDSDWFRKRLFGSMICVLLAFSILAARLFYLQVIHGEYFSQMSKNNCIRLQRVNPIRGLIFDRSGKLLVENRPSFDLSIIPKDAKPMIGTLEKLSTYAPEFSENIKKRLDDPTFGCGYGYKPVLLEKDISRNTLAMILPHRFDLPGIVIDTAARRNYLFDKFASHVIGYLGEITTEELEKIKFKYKRCGDVVGRYGIEKVYDEYLSGIPGGEIVQVNANGQVVDVLDTVTAEPGHNIFLTIDYDLQVIAESLMVEKTGAVVAMDPLSGEILAMASSPSFNQNDFINGISSKQWNNLVSDPGLPMLNKVIQGEYPPASTYKVVTAIAALEEGLIDENTTYYCPGHYKYGNSTFGCWKKQGHGQLNVIDALAQSCDVFFYNVGKKLGVDKIAWYAKGCGLGSKTGIDLGMESDGLIPTAAWKKKHTGRSWQGGENLSISIGQGFNLTTPLQLLVLYSAIANGGVKYKPIILKSINTVEGDIMKTGSKKIVGRLPVSHQTLNIVKKGLWGAVNNKQGTARWHVHDKNINISGKTGTAQVVSRRVEKDNQKSKSGRSFKSHGWFIGYAPSDDPKIVVTVLVEHGEHGSSAAGPIAKEMIVSYLKSMIEDPLKKIQ